MCRILAVVIFLISTNAQAAFVTTNEAGVNAIYSQPSFDTPVNIQFAPTISVNAPLNINTSEDLFHLFTSHSSASISLYFVDTISQCDTFNIFIVGCAIVNGNSIAVESTFAAGPNGAALIAHEIGHSLSLGHVGFANLMNSGIGGNTNLEEWQADQILGSPKVYGGVDVTPILVTPLPPAGILFISAIFGLLGIARRYQLSQYPESDSESNLSVPLTE